MMDERDYLLRMVQRLIEAVQRLIARARKLQLEKNDAQALVEVAEAYRELFGVDARFVHLMGAEEVRRMLGARVQAFAEVVRLEAELRRALGDGQRAELLDRLAQAL